jgi:hypothetical protein
MLVGNDGSYPPKYAECEIGNVPDAPSASSASPKKYIRLASWRRGQRQDGKLHLFKGIPDPQLTVPASKKRWKPMIFQAPVLGVFIFVSLSIIVLLEILSHISSGNGNLNGGGLIFAPDVNSLPPTTTFG